MNCKQAEELLPLCISHDLPASRERLVVGHLESCAKCSAVAAEQRQTRQLLQEFAPPVFSEDVYATIRRNVWRQIEAECAAPSRWEIFFGLLRPRWTWAFASVALIAVSLFGFYLMGSRPNIPARLAATFPATTLTASDKSARTTQEDRQSPPASSVTGRRSIRRPIRRNLTDRADSVIAAQAAPVKDLGPATSSAANAGRAPEKTVRIEIQTKNPNIRIIWFSQPDQKRDSPNLKGT